MDTILGGKPRENGDSKSVLEEVEEEEKSNKEADDVSRGNTSEFPGEREPTGRESADHSQNKGPTESAKQIGRQLVRLETILTRLFKPQLQQDLYHVYAAMVNILVSETGDDTDIPDLEDQVGNYPPLISPMSDEASRDRERPPMK
mmetsp:Transcript_25347/g.35385  ORF Transcript_25347/g.35385 Transcript_25347/m.35385 type:complete len:146 (+) Transcript_25347:132-569(+)